MVTIDMRNDATLMESRRKKQAWRRQRTGLPWCFQWQRCYLVCSG